MRILRVMLIVLALCVVGTLSISCGPESDTTAVTGEQLVAVQRGDLIIDITAVGNLAFSYQEELTFEVGGTVGEVLVEDGDSVEEEQVLAKLDDTSIISLQETVSQAEINLEQARINLRDAEENLEEAQHPSELDVAQAEASVANAKVALEAAQEALEEAENPYDESDITQAELAVINAEIALDKAEDDFKRAWDRYVSNRTVPEWRWDYEQKQKELAIAEFDLAEAEDDLADMKDGADTLEVEQKQKQLAVAQANLKEAEDDLAEIQAWIEGDVGSREVELKQLEVATTQAALEVDIAQAALDEAIERLETATMVAPFAGLITSVNAEVGNAVSANQVVIELVDPTKFEADILVSEMDIFQVKLGGEAWVQIDAMSGINLPAKVTHISPTATIQAGVVNYKVRVEIESLETVMQERQETRQDISSGELPEQLRQAIEAGRITQEQAEEMMRRMQEGGMPLPPGDGLLPMMLEDFQLREGLTVTVSIIVEERDDVLLVPNGAIIRQGLETYVQVLEDGVIEQRSIITGISDWQYTEVIEGLSEGEKVVIPETTTPTTPESGMPFFPGRH
jgi:multidrug efflux pump subunit AcrA (membrane-fusion protein)